MWYNNLNLFFKIWEVIKMQKGKESVSELLSLVKTSDGRRELFHRYREVISYLFFGVLTTLVSIISYAVFRAVFPNAESVPAWLSWIFTLTERFGVESNTIFPNILSWILASTFAFITNRVFVFKSENRTFSKVFPEALKFYASRLSTLLVDVLLMFLLVDLTGFHAGWYELLAKIFTNVVVIVLNYIFSKIFVFRKKKP